MDIPKLQDVLVLLLVIHAFVVQQVLCQSTVISDVTTDRISTDGTNAATAQNSEISTLESVMVTAINMNNLVLGLSTEIAAIQNTHNTETAALNIDVDLKDITTGKTMVDETTENDVTVTMMSSTVTEHPETTTELIDLTTENHQSDATEVSSNPFDSAQEFPDNTDPNKIDQDAKKSSTRGTKPTKVPSTTSTQQTRSTTLSTGPSTTSSTLSPSTMSTTSQSTWLPFLQSQTSPSSTVSSPSTILTKTTSTATFTLMTTMSSSLSSSSTTSTTTTTKPTTSSPPTTMETTPSTISTTTTPLAPSTTSTTTSSTTSSTTSTTTTTTQTTSQPSTLTTTLKSPSTTTQSLTTKSTLTTKKTPSTTAKPTTRDKQKTTTISSDTATTMATSDADDTTPVIINPEETIDDKKTSKGPIIGLITGVSLLTLILLAVLVAILCRRRQKRRRINSKQPGTNFKDLTTIQHGSHPEEVDDIAPRPAPIGQSDNFDSSSQRLPPIGESDAKPESKQMPPSILKKPKKLKRSSRHIEPNPSLHIMLQDINIDYDTHQLAYHNGAENNAGFDYNKIAEDVGYEQFQAIYYNMNPIPRPIPLSRFPQYMQEKKATPAILPEEYLGILQGLLAESWSGQHPSNAYKNKYSNVIAYDHSRVRLTTGIHERDNSYHGGYINANYISGYNHVKNMYIATQSPTSRTVNDFWLMAWEASASRIVMLCDLKENGRALCTQYWPKGGQVVFGEISVSLSKIWTYSDHTVRLFTVTRGTSSRLIHQYNFYSWPDQGVPRDSASVVNFREKVKGHEPAIGPIIVHCNSGIGATGVFLALDYLLDQGTFEGGVDIVSCVRKMRWARPNMVQNLEQYAFLYDCLLVTSLNSDADDYLQLVVDNSIIPSHGRRSILIEDSDTRNLLASEKRDGVYGTRTLPYDRSAVYIQTPIAKGDIYNRPRVVKAQVPQRGSQTLVLPTRQPHTFSRQPSYEQPITSLAYNPNTPQPLNLRPSAVMPQRQGYSTFDHRVVPQQSSINPAMKSPQTMTLQRAGTSQPPSSKNNTALMSPQTMTLQRMGASVNSPSSNNSALMSPQTMTLQRAGMISDARRPSEPIFKLSSQRPSPFVQDIRRPSDPLPVIEMRRISEASDHATPRRQSQVQFNESTLTSEKKNHHYAKISKPDIYARVVKPKNKQNPVLPQHVDIYNLHTLERNELKPEESINIDNPGYSNTDDMKANAAGSNGSQQDNRNDQSNGLSNLVVLY